MMLRFLPWRLLLSRVAKKFGFVDPVEVMSHLERFGQPSEVSVPIELLRAGVVFHARGLMNTKAIQFNLDWVWPYWVQRQFNPADHSFVPRAFSFTHINMTHRNWTGLGLPDCEAMPIVDPRGLVTPFFDGWSLDAWLVAPGNRELLSSRAGQAEQRLLTGDKLAVETRVEDGSWALDSLARVELSGNEPVCRVTWRARAGEGAFLAIAPRPFNPEGVSFLYDVACAGSGAAWSLNKKACLRFSETPERHCASTYAEGDVHTGLLDRPQRTEAHCNVGLATAAALYALPREGAREVEAEVRLAQDPRTKVVVRAGRVRTWAESLEGACEADLPDARMQQVYDAALRTLVLLSPREVYPGPYTYKRFWFRDASLMLHAMLCAGLTGRAERALAGFPARQRIDGFFLSQQGEWDSNGAALWAMARLGRLAGKKPDETWRRAVHRGAAWLRRKRPPRDGVLHAGLLPAGFSAEHLGNNDYYYWDDYWAVAGLREAAWMCDQWDEGDRASTFREEARDLLESIEESLARSEHIRGRPGLPASPYRRMDAGAIGSIVAGYPLRIYPPDDERLLATVDYIVSECLVDGAFFQNMIHSGQNAYLTLMLAQVMLRAGDRRHVDLVRTVADLASPTGHWPEAIHPRTGGGCMGDGHHGWAAAEWFMMVRNMFLREENDRLVLLSGIPEDWYRSGAPMRFGPAPTEFGAVCIEVHTSDGRATVSWRGNWRGAPPPVEVLSPRGESVGPGADGATSCEFAVES